MNANVVNPEKVETLPALEKELETVVAKIAELLEKEPRGIAHYIARALVLQHEIFQNHLAPFIAEVLQLRDHPGKKPDLQERKER